MYKYPLVNDVIGLAHSYTCMDILASNITILHGINKVYTNVRHRKYLSSVS